MCKANFRRSLRAASGVVCVHHTVTLNFLRNKMKFFTSIFIQMGKKLPKVEEEDCNTVAQLCKEKLLEH